MRRVAVVVALRGNQVLAVSRPDPPLRFGFPGGGVEPGEGFAQAAVRELCEETGMFAPRLVPLYEEQRRGVHMVFFCAPVVVGKLRSSHEGIAAWVERGLVLDKSAAYPEEAHRALWLADVVP